MYKRILVPLDGSPAGEEILPYALVLAGGLSADVQLMRVFSLAPMAGHYAVAGMDWEKVEGAMRGETDAYLEEVRGGLNTETTTVTAITAEGLTANSIITEASSQSDTLVAMTTHARGGVVRGIIGSVTDDVLRNGDSPMLVLRSRDDEEDRPVPALDTVVVALDGSPLAEEVLPHAVAVAKALDLKIDLLTVLPGNDPAFGDGSQPSAVRDKSLAYLHSTQDWMRGQGISRVGQVVLHGPPAAAIIDLVDNLPGAIVAMTTHGWSGAERWLLGSVAERVVRHAQRPVLLVRAQN